MVAWASTGVLVSLQESLPNPLSKTAAPFLPTTTAAPGYPPALIPRSTTRWIAARRVLDIPTSVGDLTGRPSPARVTVRAVRMTLSNANSMNYLHLYWPYAAEVPDSPDLPCNSTKRQGVQLQTIPERERHRFFRGNFYYIWRD